MCCTATRPPRAALISARTIAASSLSRFLSARSNVKIKSRNTYRSLIIPSGRDITFPAHPSISESKRERGYMDDSVDA